MADISSQQLDALIEVMRKSAGSLAKISGEGGNSRRGSSDSARKTLERDLAKGAKDIARAGVDAIDSVRVRGNDVFDSISRMATVGLKMAFVGEAIRRIGDLNKTYTSLAEVGQTFSGSMMKMSIAAGDAGMPLREFADMILKNTEAAAELGADGFGQLAAGVRKVAEKQGMYGYSLDQLNGQTAEYLKTARLFGPLERLTRGDAIKDFSGLAKQTSVLANVTGKARSEIAQLAQTAMRSSLVIGQMYRIEESQRMKSMKTLAEATTFMAAQQGEAGRMLSSLVADTFGAGSSIFTEGGKQFIEAGIGQMAGATDILNAKIMSKTASDADYVRYQNELIDTIDNNIETLRIQALSGNAAAAAMLTMRGEMDKMTMAQIRQKKMQMENTATMTSFITSFESGFKRVIGGFESGFLKAMTPLMDKFTKWLTSPDFDAFVKTASDFGVRVGKLVSGLFNDTSIEDIMVTGAKLWNGLKAVGSLLMGVFDLIVEATPYVATLLSWITSLASGFATLVSSVANLTAKLTGSENAGTVAGGAAAVGVYAAYRLAKTFVKGFFAGTVTVQGGVVNVLGAGGLGGLGGGGAGGGGRWGAAKGAIIKVAKFAANPKILVGAVIAGVLAAGAFKLLSGSPAAASTLSSGSNATGGGLRVTDPKNISDPRVRSRFQSLLRQKQQLAKEADSPEKAAKLAAISSELAGIRNQYGSNIGMNQVNNTSYAASAALAGIGGSPAGRTATRGAGFTALAIAGGAGGMALGYKGAKMLAGRSAAMAGARGGGAGAGGSKLFDSLKGLAGRSGLKLVGRLLPFVGSIYFLYSAYQRLMAGDTVGAMIDVAGAGLSLIPGAGGIVAGVGLGAVNAFRDSNRTAGSAGATPAAAAPEEAPTFSNSNSPSFNDGQSQINQLISQQDKTLDTLARLLARANALSEENNRLLAKINNKE